ncbi:MAG: histidine phosphatase family protein [Pseudonocardiaceae bacterium]|nr:histidine phosphatase family protein [Pseudonocardiaceae bacterium]
MTRPDARGTDRYEAPHYLARYKERQGRTAEATPHGGDGDDDGTPLYLKRFRARSTAPTQPAAAPLIQAGDEAFTADYAEATREKEIVAPPELREAEQIVAEIRIIRHGITQGYSSDAGLTPMGGWQAHQRGHSLSKSVRDGQRVRIVCADTNRARQTAHQIHRGMLDGLEQWQHKADVSDPEAIPELRNFQVWTPDGMRDITSAFRTYHAQMERLERMAVGERPRWLVEIDRFYRTQFGGADPIHMWMTIPMMYFEPPQACVRRFWRGFHRLIDESDAGARIVAATHSGPIRAFATWAHGYDPGEPYNTEEVVVKVRNGGQSALVAYRNRVTEVNIPPADEFPDWEV